MRGGTRAQEVRPAFDDPVDPPRDGAPWTVLRLLRWSTRYLRGKGVPEARLDAEHLLAHALDTGRLELYLEFERPLTPPELDRFRPLLRERAGRKPLQYILGTTSFRELELRIDDRALVPRPETEELVEAVLARAREWGRGDLDALDVATGSGAVALALAAEGPFRRVVATDRAGPALALARENAERLGLSARVQTREGDLLQPVETGERFHVLVSNLPYVTEEEFDRLEPEVRAWEPRDALVAPEGGLALIRELVRDAHRVLLPGGFLALEVGAGQARAVEEAIRSRPELGAPTVLKDLSGKERFVLAERAGGREEEGAGRPGPTHAGPTPPG